MPQNRWLKASSRGSSSVNQSRVALICVCEDRQFYRPGEVKESFMKIQLSKMPTPGGVGKPIQPSNVSRGNRSIPQTTKRGEPYKLLGAVNVKVMIKLVIIAITVSVGGLGMGWKPLGDKTKYRITWKTPQAGSYVDQTNIVRGTIYPKPEGMSLWIFEQPAFGDAYPKRVPVKSNGDFEAIMPFGDLAHRDTEFQLYGMVLQPETHFREMDKIKIIEVPKGQKITPMSVIRK